MASSSQPFVQPTQLVPVVLDLAAKELLMFLVLGDQPSGPLDLCNQPHPIELVSLVWHGHRCSPRTVTARMLPARGEAGCPSPRLEPGTPVCDKDHTVASVSRSRRCCGGRRSVEYVAAAAADHQRHGAGEAPAALLAGLFLLELRSLTQRADKLGRGHCLTVAEQSSEEGLLGAVSMVGYRSVLVRPRPPFASVPATDPSTNPGRDAWGSSSRPMHRRRARRRMGGGTGRGPSSCSLERPLTVGRFTTSALLVPVRRHALLLTHGCADRRRSGAAGHVRGGLGGDPDDATAGGGEPSRAGRDPFRAARRIAKSPVSRRARRPPRGTNGSRPRSPRPARNPRQWGGCARSR